MTRKKGKKAQKPEEQFQPDYVKRAKEDSERARKMKKQISKEEMQKIESFWQRRNPKARMLKGNYGESKDMAK